MARVRQISTFRSHRRFLDHQSRPVMAFAWSEARVDRHRLGLQVYPLASLGTDDNIMDICRRLIKLDTWQDFHRKQVRIDMYSPQDSVEACMAHHRREKEHRQHTGGPDIVPTWSGVDYGTNLRNWILVIDKGCATWHDIEQEGLLSVQFEWDGHPDDVCELDDWEPEGEVPPGDYHSFVRVYSRQTGPHIRRALVDAERCARDDYDRSLGILRFYDIASSLLCLNRQCCWDGLMDCELCDAKLEHDRCLIVE